MNKGRKFGVFGGVFTPSILSILGVIMYLRLPWIVGQAGLLSTIGIILVAHIISLTTGLSISSIATDKRVGTGGSYFIISRSLGLPIGGTLGLALFVGLSFSVSLYLIGFSETFLNYYGFDASLNSIRIAGSITLFFVLIVTFISTSLTIKTQYIIMSIIALSLVSMLFGSHDFTPAAPQIGTMKDALPWITLFAIFFPAVTGFQAGVSMSGDLKDPRKSIPIGTILAVVVGLIIYLGLAVFFAYTVDRDLLVDNPNILFEISWVPQLVVAGILGATLSSAFGSILGAPRILQAIAADRIVPKIFSVGFGPSNEPRNALLFTFLIAQAGILIGELNVIARIVTIFFIITYGFLNLTYSIENWASSDFRPKFRIPSSISIIGALACIIIMIQLDLLALIGASFVLMGIFLYLKKRELTLQSGDTWSGVWTSLVKTGLRKLMLIQKKQQHWRPNIILFSGGASARPHLLEFGKMLVGKLGIFTNFQLIEDPSKNMLLSRRENIQTEELGEQKGIITRKHVCNDIYEGIETISRIYGFTGFEPNTILMGWAKNTKNPKRFSSLLHQLSKSDFNQVFLKYDKESGFGNHKKIDLWWNGKGKNLSFGLTLLKYITASPIWRRASIRILVINNDSQLTESYYTLLQQLQDDQRISINAKVINNSIEKLPEHQIIKSESYNSDLTILEIPDFSSKEAETIFSKISSLTEILKTCVVIKGSSGFDEITVDRQSDQDEISDKSNEKSKDKTPINISLRIKTPTKEIIANHIYNLANSIDTPLQKFLKDYIYNTRNNYIGFTKELDSFIDKTFSSLEKALLKDNAEEKNKAILNVLNDFAFHAKMQLSKYNDTLIEKEKEKLQTATESYINETQKIVSSLPRHIIIKTGKRSKHKIKYFNNAKYLVYFNRLKSIEKHQEELVKHSFTAVSDLRKIYNSTHELIEKIRLESSGNASTVLQMEKQRITVKVSDFEEKHNDFYNTIAHNHSDNLVNDIDTLGHILEGQRSSYLSTRYKKEFKKEKDLREIIETFPDLWNKGIKSFINKGYLDFLFLSLHARLGAKILKHNKELSQSIHQNLIKAIKNVEEIALKHLDNKSSKEIPALDFKLIPDHEIEIFYNKLFEEIFEALQDLPETVEISSLNISETKDIEKLKDTATYVLGIRKTSEFYISSELIDYVKGESRKAENNLSAIINNTRDAIRLANFNLQANKDKIINEDSKNQVDHSVILEELINTLKTQEQKINQQLSELEEITNDGLNKAFDPLSSSVIIQTSRSLKKKLVENGNNKFGKKIKYLTKRFNTFIQNQFVKVLYTRSEGILWTEKLEGTSVLKQNTYENAHLLIESVSPDKEVLKSLPFYYTNLFSGFSGIGEDFWVGMEAETNKCDAGIKKFISGQPGIILIKGKR